jgi:SAM-dependent methyltransferase
MAFLEHNRKAWDRQVEEGNIWTVPAGPEEISEARQGRWQIVLTPSRPVPVDWFPPLQGLDVLCLASGGGQQGPILAAAGANVTVFDNSPRQLAQDRLVADREGLSIKTVQGDMADLSVFPDESFDLVVHPASNSGVPDVLPVWREAYRVLRPGGALLSGFGNPVIYIFDYDKNEQGILEVKYSIPYSDLESLTDEQKQKFIEQGLPFEFGHTLEDLIGGQLRAGFIITGFYEDDSTDLESDPVSKYMPVFMATRAIKPKSGGKIFNGN